LLPILNGGFNGPEGVWVNTEGNIGAESLAQRNHRGHLLLRLKHAPFELDGLKTKLDAHRFCLGHNLRRTQRAFLPGRSPARCVWVGIESQSPPAPSYL